MLTELYAEVLGRKAALDTEIQSMRERLVELEKERKEYD